MCQCWNCKNRVESQKPYDIPRLCGTILGFGCSPSVLLFALLVYIECPHLIVGFLERNCSDKRLEQDLAAFSEDYIRRTCWPLYDEKNPASSKRLAERFRSNKYSFIVPRIEDGVFVEYDRSRILPFFNEKPLGRRTDDGEIIQEGAYGRVYSFDIFEEYKAFQVCSTTVLVTKQSTNCLSLGMPSMSVTLPEKSSEALSLCALRRNLKTWSV